MKTSTTTSIADTGLIAAPTDSLPAHKRLPDSPGRCSYRFGDRRRCRLQVTAESAPFCLNHAWARTPPPADTDLAPALLGELSEITTPAQVQAVLGKLFVLLAQNRVETRKAAVLTYILQHFLRTFPVIKKAEDGEPQRVIIDVPRPNRNQQPEGSMCAT